MAVEMVLKDWCSTMCISVFNFISGVDLREVKVHNECLLLLAVQLFILL